MEVKHIICLYQLSYLQWSRYDDVLEKILQTTELEDRQTSSLVYITSLQPLHDANSCKRCRSEPRIR
jgi:hypothetical protein